MWINWNPNKMDDDAVSSPHLNRVAWASNKPGRIVENFIIFTNQTQNGGWWTFFWKKDISQTNLLSSLFGFTMGPNWTGIYLWRCISKLLFEGNFIKIFFSNFFFITLSIAWKWKKSFCKISENLRKLEENEPKSRQRKSFYRRKIFIISKFRFQF